MRLAQTINNGELESAELAVVFGREAQALLFDELPQPLNQVEIGRVGWQEAEFNM